MGASPKHPYGAKEQAVTITVRRADLGAAMSVHNAGEPIAIADQLSIFDTFSRRGVAKVRPGGWGLGPALVKGRAADQPGEPNGAMP
jgi:signal transduction histidine kinase